MGIDEYGNKYYENRAYFIGKLITQYFSFKHNLKQILIAKGLKFSFLKKLEK